MALTSRDETDYPLSDTKLRKQVRCVLEGLRQSAGDSQG